MTTVRNQLSEKAQEHLRIATVKSGAGLIENVNPALLLRLAGELDALSSSAAQSKRIRIQIPIESDFGFLSRFLCAYQPFRHFNAFPLLKILKISLP
jgi:hypothetical protein